MHRVFIRVIIAVISNKQLGGGIYLFCLKFWITIYHLGKLGQEFKAGTEADTTEGAADWLDPHDFLSLLSYATQDHLPRGVEYWQWAGPSYINLP